MTKVICFLHRQTRFARGDNGINKFSSAPKSAAVSVSKKYFFDTPETVEKATKPSEPHSSAYRGTAECGSRRKSKCSIINSFKPIPIKNRKKNFKSQKDSFVKKVVL